MNYEDLTLKELKEILKERNLKVSGKKAELVQRLQESDKEITKAPEEESIQDEENIDEDYSEDEYDDDKYVNDFYVYQEPPEI